MYFVYVFLNLLWNCLNLPEKFSFFKLLGQWSQLQLRWDHFISTGDPKLRDPTRPDQVKNFD